MVTFIALQQGREVARRPKGVSRDHPHRGDGLLTVLGLDFILTAMMFAV